MNDTEIGALRQKLASRLRSDERAPDGDHLQKPAQPVMGIFHLDLVCETTRQMIEIICHSAYQM